MLPSTPQDLLKPDSSRVQIHLRDFLRSSKKLSSREIFHWNDPSSFESSFKKTGKFIETSNVFKEILKGIPLHELPKGEDNSKDEDFERKFWSHRRKASKSQWEENLPKITKSFLLANNGNAGALKHKNDVVLGKKNEIMIGFLKAAKPDLLSQALNIEKHTYYPRFQRNFSEKNLGKTRKGKLCVNNFQIKPKPKEKVHTRELRQDLIITRNELKPSKVVYF